MRPVPSLGLSLLGLAVFAQIAVQTACAPKPESVAEMYSVYCQRCHGADGTGDRRSVGLNPRLDLTKSAMLQDQIRPLVYQRIKNGYGTMPAFGHQLSHSEISDLTGYVLESFGSPDADRSSPDAISNSAAPGDRLPTQQEKR